MGWRPARSGAGPTRGRDVELLALVVAPGRGR